ncbi:hypothetical protein Ddye_015012 [Dipteronia dyeriana]|uniref:Non-specific lipid-transfer protein n=1 Tax=Dipteronia dyeriana TaxID=168575 RepID=A0AAD9WYS3_9ROSI|nr:hypothetical protein Ddye_015012 [Dipteronia dyeriana]
MELEICLMISSGSWVRNELKELVWCLCASQAAISCGQVTSSIGPCIRYLRSGIGAVPPACCSGIKTLAEATTTTPDRQAACKCLKSAASSISGINSNAAAGLPGNVK